MNLPDMTGIELRKRLASDPRTEALCGVALSADCMADDISHALAAGFKDCAPKPINVVRPVKSLHRLMSA